MNVLRIRSVQFANFAKLRGELHKYPLLPSFSEEVGCGYCEYPEGLQDAKQLWFSRIESGRSSMMTRCLQCDAEFDCSPTAPCWCAELPPLPITRDIAGSQCLCRRCLEQRVRDEAERHRSEERP